MRLSRKKNIKVLSVNALTKKEVALLFGVSVRTITNWQKEEAFPRNVDGSYPGPACIKWLEARFEDRGGVEIETAEAQKWLTEFRKERALIARIEREKLEETLFSKVEISKAWSERVQLVCSGLELFADRLPPLLDGKRRIDMFEIIRQEVWELRNAYCRDGRYCPKGEK